MSRTPEQEADLRLLRPLAEQMRPASLGFAKAKMTEKQVRAASDEMFYLIADNIRNYLKQHGVGLVRLQ